MNKILTILLFSIFVTTSSQATGVSKTVMQLKYGMSQSDVQKILGNPTTKDSVNWVYVAEEANPGIELGWKNGKLEQAIIQPNIPQEAESLLPLVTKGVADLKEERHDIRTGRRAFLVPNQGLRLVLTSGNQVSEIVITNPWPTKEKTMELSAFLKLKAEDRKLKKEGAKQ